MGTLESSLYTLRRLDSLSLQRTFIHRLDPRVKIGTTLGFIAAVVSFNKYEIAGLLPFVFFPLFVAAGGNLPLNYFLKRLLHLSPFVLFIGVFNPLIDRTVLVRIGEVRISGGWVSFAAILIRYCLTVSAALMLIATTGFISVCHALEKLRVPRVFIVQLLFVYRYIFVLIEEALRMVRARNLRSFKRRGTGVGVFIPLVGTLLMRTLERAQSVYRGMLSRGFDGDIRVQYRLRIKDSDTVYLFSWISTFTLLRLFNLSLLLGNLITGML